MDSKYCCHRQLADIAFKDLVAILADDRIVYTREDEYDSKYHATFDWDKYDFDGRLDASGIPIPGNFQLFASYVESTFSRVTVKGSHGFWQYINLLDIIWSAFDDNGQPNMANVVDPLQLHFGVIDNTNSDEASHRWLKEDLQKLEATMSRGTIVSKMKKLLVVGKNYSRTECLHHGISVFPRCMAKNRCQ